MDKDKGKKGDYVVLAKPSDRLMILTKEGYEKLTRPFTDKEKEERKKFFESCRKCAKLFKE